MSRSIKHFSLHRILGVDLRVVADVESGVLPVIESEEAVIHVYLKHAVWPHRWVTLFLLEDLSPLIRQLQGAPGGLEQAAVEALAGRIDPATWAAQSIRLQTATVASGLADLQDRPVLNLYDQANLDGCNVFANQHALTRLGYWTDRRAWRGLLAHEHAHPMAENDCVRSTHSLRLEANLDLGELASEPGLVERRAALEKVLTDLATRLSLLAPRELFANQVALTAGFSDSLLYLNTKNLTRSGGSLAGRALLSQQLQAQVRGGQLSQRSANILLLVGDLTSILDLALETAPFQRANIQDQARAFSNVLHQRIFPNIHPSIPKVFSTLEAHYLTLTDDLYGGVLLSWMRQTLNLLVEALARQGLRFDYQLRQAEIA